MNYLVWAMMMECCRNSLLISLHFFLSSSAIIVDSTMAQEINTEINAAYFSHAPRLLGAATTFSSVRARGAKYYFNIELPQDAGNNLQQVAIAQRQGQETIDFKLEETVAYIGTNRQKKERIAIADVRQNKDTGEITVFFAQAIDPGTIFTVGLKPKRNPFYGGVYLFGVRAYPQGNNPTSLYLGAGRLHFYRGNSFIH